MRGGGHSIEQHIHRSAWEKLWLPIDNGIQMPHPVCRECGITKNISGDRAKGLGYFVNALAEIKRHLERKGGKLTEVQRRLIIKELERMEDFADTYATRGSVQKNIFISCVRKYTSLSRSFIESFL